MLIPISPLMVFRNTTNSDGSVGFENALFSYFTKKKSGNYSLYDGATQLIDEYNGLNIGADSEAMQVFLQKTKSADEGMFQFFNTLNGSNATLNEYAKFCKRSSSATSAFNGALAKLGVTAKSVLLNFAAFAAATLIFEGLKWIWSLVPTYEHLNEKLEESRAAAEESQQKLDSLNDELKTTRNRLVELEGVDKLSVVEEAELKRLKARNAELEVELELQKKINAEKQKDKYEDAYKVAKKTSGGFSQYINDVVNVSGYSDLFAGRTEVEKSEASTNLRNRRANLNRELLGLDAKADDYDTIADAYESEIKRIDSLIDSIESGDAVIKKRFFVTADNERYVLEKIQKIEDNLSGTEWTPNAESGSAQERVNEAWEYVYGLKEAVLAYNGNFDDLWNYLFSQKRFDDATERLTALGDSGELSAEELARLYKNNNKIKQFIDYLTQIGMLDLTDADKNRDGALSIEELTAAFASLSTQLNVITAKVDENKYTVSSAETIYSGLKDKVSLLAEAYSQMDSNGELSTETAAKLIDQYPDLIDCLEVEGGQIKINKDLLAEKVKLERQNQIESVKSAKASAEAAKASAEAALEEAKVKLALAKIDIERAKLTTDGLRQEKFGSHRADGLGDVIENRQANLDEINSDLDKLNAELALLENLGIDDFIGSGKKTSSSTDELKKAFEAEYDILKAEKEKMDAGFAWDTSIIADAEDYFNKLGALNDKFFKNDKDHAEEYGKYSLEVLNGRRDLVLQEFETEKRRIELADKEYGKNSLNEKLSAYTAMKQKLHELAEEYRTTMLAAGASQEWIENSEYIKELQDKWWDAEDAAIDSVVNEYKRWVDAQKDAIEKSIDYYDHLIDKQKAFIDGEKNLYDAENDIRSIRRDIEKELRTNKALSEYLDEDTRKLLFNEDDYNHLSSVLTGISSEIEDINVWYNTKINALTEDTWYLEEEITAEYERRLAVEEKKYELARQQLDLEKKKLELNNVLNERNIRMLTKNENGDYEWTYVHDAEKAAEVVGEISDIENEIEDIKVKSAQEASIAEKERLTKIYGTINGASEQRKKELDESVDDLEKVVDEMKSPILEFTDIVSAASKTMNETIKKYFGDNIDISDYDALHPKNKNVASGSSSGSSEGSSGGGTTYSSEERAVAIEGMRQNSEAWLNTKDAAERKRLEAENQSIGKDYGLTYDAASGKWYLDKDKTQLAYSVTKHADGTLFAEKGFSLLNDGAGLEILRTKSGALVDLTGGETVFNNKQTEFLYKLSKTGTFPKLAGSETNTNYNFKGDIVLKDVQNPQDFIRALSKELKQNSFKNK